MNGLVLEGGARRCIFTAGVLDCFMDNLIEFDYVAGVSNGAQAGLNFVSGQRGRSRDVMMPYIEKFTEKIQDPLSSDLHKIIYEFSYSQYPFDFDKFFSSGVECEIVATDCIDAAPEYFSVKDDEKRLLDCLRASCSLPLLFPTVTIDGREYMDGSITDAIPFERAFSRGCDRVVAVNSKPVDESATDYSKLGILIRNRYSKIYPKLTERLLNRLQYYQQQCRQLQERIDEGSLFLIRPDETYVKSYELNREHLEAAYDIGYRMAEEKMPELRRFLHDKRP